MFIHLFRIIVVFNSQTEEIKGLSTLWCFMSTLRIAISALIPSGLRWWSMKWDFRSLFESPILTSLLYGLTDIEQAYLTQIEHRGSCTALGEPGKPPLLVENRFCSLFPHINSQAGAFGRIWDWSTPPGPSVSTPSREWIFFGIHWIPIAYRRSCWIQYPQINGRVSISPTFYYSFLDFLPTTLECKWPGS